MRTAASTRTAASARTSASVRTASPQFHMPVGILDLGITHFYSWRGGHAGANPRDVADEIGNLNVTYRGGSALSSVYSAGNYYADLELSSTDYFKSLDTKISPTAMTAFTLFAWYKLEATNAGGMQLISCYRQSGTLRSWSLRYVGSTGVPGYPNAWRMFLTSDGSNATQYTKTTVGDHASDLGWHFVTYTYAPGGDTFYVDGVNVGADTTQGTLPASIFNPTQGLDIGMLTASGGGTSSPWDGRIGLCGFSINTTLSSAQVTTLYNATNAIGRYV